MFITDKRQCSNQCGDSHSEFEEFPIKIQLDTIEGLPSFLDRKRKKKKMCIDSKYRLDLPR